MSVADYLLDFERLGSAPAFAERRGYRMVRWSYGQVAQTAYRLARELNARQLSKGATLMLWGPNSAAWIAAFFACANRGVIVVPMDDAASSDFALRVFTQVKAALLICSRAHAQAAVPTLFIEDLRDAVSRHSSAALPTQSRAEDALEIVFTSGTTAEPKGVVITHANVLANVTPLENQIRSYLKYERFVHPIRFLNLLPLSHVFGQFLGMYLPSLMGGVVFFQQTLKPGEVVGTIRQERISVLVAVPRMLQSLKEKVERDVENAGNREWFQQAYKSAAGKHFVRQLWTFRRIHKRFGWKFWAFISGGAALDADTEEFWRRLGFAVIQGYGLTETTSLISVNHPFKVGRGSIGKVLEGREIKLAPDGEILVRGGGVASGYWSEGKLQPVAADEGWYRTGDVGELDVEGNLYFKGRKKDVIVTPAGMNIYPEDLETALRHHPQVRDCVVVPFALAGNAEPLAALILKNSADAAAIVRETNERLAEYQRIHRWIIWPADDFPRTSTQKPRRTEIAATARKLVAGAEPTSSESPVSDLISRILKRPVGYLPRNANLDADLNLSSLDRVELLSALEERFQIDLSESRFSAMNSVADLEQMLKGEAPPRAIYHYPAWVQHWPVTWIRVLVHYLLLIPSVFVLGWPRVIGRDNLAEVQGPALVVCNHIDDVDVGFVLTALPPRFRHKLAAAAGGEALEALRTPAPSRNFFLRLFDRVEWFAGVSLLNLFPLPRQAGFRESFAYAGESVDRGYSILVFPEGHHTTDGKIRPFRSGIGLLAKNLGIPVIPMRIDGLFEVKQAHRRVARPHQIQVRIGAPMTFPRDAEPQEIAAKLQATVETL